MAGGPTDADRLNGNFDNHDDTSPGLKSPPGIAPDPKGTDNKDLAHHPTVPTGVQQCHRKTGLSLIF